MYIYNSYLYSELYGCSEKSSTRSAGDLETGYGYNANELEDFEVTS